MIGFLCLFTSCCTIPRKHVPQIIACHVLYVHRKKQQQKKRNLWDDFFVWFVMIWSLFPITYRVHRFKTSMRRLPLPLSFCVCLQTRFAPPLLSLAHSWVKLMSTLEGFQWSWEVISFNADVYICPSVSLWCSGQMQVEGRVIIWIVFICLFYTSCHSVVLT